MNRAAHTAAKDERFLAAISAGQSVRQACKTAGCARSNMYLRKAEDEQFRLAWESAERDALELLEEEADRRGKEGTVKPVFYKGELCGQYFDELGLPVPGGALDAEGNRLAVRFEPHGVREFSDTLLIVRLKALDREKYRERQAVDVAAPGGGAVQVRHQHELPPALQEALQALSGRGPLPGARH